AAQSREKLEKIVGSYKEFRICTTQNKLSDVFEDKYHNDYDDIYPIVKSHDKSAINSLKDRFVSHFKQDIEFSSKIRNEDAETAEEMRDGDTYRLFVVVRS
ncbi:MAG: hypothetical protein ACRDFC_01990, partial [Ignavibacteria bacterium]